MSFPGTPMTGKNGKVLMNNGDGALSTLLALTKQASYTYKGEVLVNRIYLAGTGKTLINDRPAIAPRAFVDGIVDGIKCTPSAVNDEVQTSAGSINVAGVDIAVAADTSIALTRPAATQAAWYAISVNKGTQAVTVTKGADTTAGTGKTALLTTYGSAAGQKPYVATDEIVICYISLINGAALVSADEISETDRENGDMDLEIMVNQGGVKVPFAFPLNHTGGVDRGVKFTGYFMDGVLEEIGTAKDWALNFNKSDVSDVLLGRTVYSSELTNASWTANQLAVGRLALNNLLKRQGFCAVRLVYPNGGYWQTVGSFTGNFSNAPGAFIPISLSGTCSDLPEFV